MSRWPPWGFFQWAYRRISWSRLLGLSRAPAFPHRDLACHKPSDPAPGCSTDAIDYCPGFWSSLRFSEAGIPDCDRFTRLRAPIHPDQDRRSARHYARWRPVVYEASSTQTPSAGRHSPAPLPEPIRPRALSDPILAVLKHLRSRQFASDAPRRIRENDAYALRRGPRRIRIPV